MANSAEHWSRFPVGPWRTSATQHLADPKAPLSPKGAFTIEMWIKPKPDLGAQLSPVLIDRNTSRTPTTSSVSPRGTREAPVACKSCSDSAKTPRLSIPRPSSRHRLQHVAFTYDAAGTVRFFRNGAPLGAVARSGRGPVAPGRHALSIGDRVGSNYAGFPGYIDEVRICNGSLEFRPIAVEFQSERWTWRRMEKAQPIKVLVRNLARAAAKNLALHVSLDGSDEKTFTVPELAAGADHTIEYELDTSLRPDTYHIRARLELPGAMPFVSEEAAELVLAPRPLRRCR
jgi:hypothetical protein